MSKYLQTPREELFCATDRRLLQMLADGAVVKEAAAELEVDKRWAERRIQSMRDAWACRNVTQLVVKALAQGIIQGPPPGPGD